MDAALEAQVCFDLKCQIKNPEKHIDPSIIGVYLKNR
jgi:hypothetical protein